MTILHSARWVLFIGSLALAACTRQPAPVAWELAAQSASDRAVAAYLKGQTRVAELQWAEAFDEVAATGQPSTMARMALLQCAAQWAALEATHCQRYQRYAAGAAPAEQAYALYLQAKHSAADVPLLPAAQQAVALQLLSAPGEIQALPPAPALSQLTAAGVALRAGRLSPDAVQQAVQVASAQGWRRAAMAWLLVAQRLAQQAADTEGMQAIELRLQVLQEQQTLENKKK
ncbi:MAG: hypothetical protein KBT18_00670 [Comamonas sp.]|nr:hypothetical protein [Candidatus Comamonas equi]